MKLSIQNKQIFNDYAMFIIALIISSISTVLGIISLFIKPNLNVFQGIILMCFLLFLSSRTEYDFFGKNKNDIVSKIFYFIFCFTLIIISLFITLNLHFS